MAHYDAIVIGTGGVGSAALYHLARRGARVLGIDRFEPGHDRGSSHGQTRMIRQAYYEHPDYVPLVLRSYKLWGELAETAGRQLFHPVGLLSAGPAEGGMVGGVLESSQRHNIPVEQLTSREAAKRWPGYATPESFTSVYEPTAGFLQVEDCVVAYIEAAQAAGAELKTGVEVREWSVQSGQVEVKTDRDTHTAGKLVITAGAWAPQLLASLGVELEVRRKPLFWYACDADDYRADAGYPCFFFDLPQGEFYGFPNLATGSVKMAEHTGGQRVEDPLTVNREIVAEEQQRIEGFVADCLPQTRLERVDHAVCMYTMSPDEHFIIDRHPEYPQVAFATGLSGHGFKFASVLGEVMADWTLEGNTEQPVEFLCVKRDSLR